MSDRIDVDSRRQSGVSAGAEADAGSAGGGSGPGPAAIDDRRKKDRGDGSDRRRKPRLRVLLNATVETQDGEQTAKLRNLSPTGAQIEMDRPPAVGTLVTFRRGNTMAPATIVWARGSAIGLQFIRPIHQSEVLIHIERPDLAW